MTSDQDNEAQPPRRSQAARRSGTGSSSSANRQSARRRQPDQGDLWSDDDTPAPRSPRPAATPRSTSPAAGPPPPPPPAYPAGAYAAGYGYEEDDYYDEPQTTLLGNPYMLAALAVGAAILMAVVVVVFFGQGNDNGAGGGLAARPGTTASPNGDNGDSSFTIGLETRSIATSTVREGPGLDFLELGLLTADQDVDVVGRNEDASWIQIVFPHNTQLRGWVPNSALELPDDIFDVVALVDVTPIARPTVEEPTAVPVQPTAEQETTPQPGAEPDIAINLASECSPGQELTLLLINTGNTSFDAQPVRIVVENDGNVEFDQMLEATMQPGAGAELATGVAITPSSMTATVILDGIDDVNPANNLAVCVVGDDDDDNGGGGGNQPPPIQSPDGGQ